MDRKNKLMQAAMRLRAMPVPAGAAGIAADGPQRPAISYRPRTTDPGREDQERIARLPP